MSENWLIDAYNLMHKIPKLSRILQRNPYQAQEYLVDTISALCVTVNKSAHLVFDGAPGPLPIKRARVSTAYSRNKKADDLIIRQISKKDAARKWIVVTDDNEILQKARFYQVGYLSASEFAKSLHFPSGKSSELMEKPLQKKPDVIVSDKEVDQMLLYYKLKKKDGK